MKKSKRSIRQEKLAMLFYEMGMDIGLVSKISGVEDKKINTLVSKQKNLFDIDKKLKDNI